MSQVKRFFEVDLLTTFPKLHHFVPQRNILHIKETVQFTKRAKKFTPKTFLLVANVIKRFKAISYEFS